jgi:opacity protein-like surface antigen
VVAGPADARLVRGPRNPGLQAPASGNELVFEGGLAEPLGDLKDSFWKTETGLEAGTGYELGLRYRHYAGPGWAVSPAFHYVRFGSYAGVGDFPEGDGLGFNIEASQYRYGLDFQVFMGSPAAEARPYLTGGVALAHNIYRDRLQGWGEFREAVNNPAFNAGVGVKINFLEISGAYHFNRFSTSKFTSGPDKVDFNWDYAVFRVGFAFGRY